MPTDTVRYGTIPKLIFEEVDDVDKTDVSVLVGEVVIVVVGVTFHVELCEETRMRDDVLAGKDGEGTAALQPNNHLLTSEPALCVCGETQD